MSQPSVAIMLFGDKDSTRNALTDENYKLLADSEERLLSVYEFHIVFRRYFENDGLILSQQWNPGIANGMVRCYVTGTKVSGFDYQEAVALCPEPNDPDKVRPRTRNLHYSEQCGLLQDLRNIMESKWIPQVQKIHDISDTALPLLRDVNFFINDIHAPDAESKYPLRDQRQLCDPFPPSCVGAIVRELQTRLVSH
ncbi:MAG: hypothetical protein FWE76_03950 [Symbiobacteriaceae bacterium]|nr:hypothetical protein [Symbiobacteriaceae bacterium]